jgi:hypothetical protein
LSSISLNDDTGDLHDAYQAELDGTRRHRGRTGKRRS